MRASARESAGTQAEDNDMIIRRSAFGIEARADGSQHSIELNGEMDLSSLCAFEAKIAAVSSVRPSRIVLNLSGLTFLDVAGLRAIDHARRELVGCDIELAIIPGPPNVQRLFEFAGIAETLPFQARAAPLSAGVDLL
jgi:anti-anti-sigma factor